MKLQQGAGRVTGKGKQPTQVHRLQVELTLVGSWGLYKTV